MKGWELEIEFVYSGMKVKTSYKYAAITPEGDILNMYSNKDMYAKRETAENNLKKWAEEARSHQKNAKAYGEAHPQYAELCAEDVKRFKAQAEMFETCRVSKIKITLEVVVS